MFRLIKIAIHHPHKITKAFIVLFTKGPATVLEKLKRTDVIDNYLGFINRQYQNSFDKYYPTKKILQRQKNQSKKFKYQPKISIITPTFNTPENFLKDAIESVINQSYENWELCLCDDFSTNQNVRNIILEYAKSDKRIKYFFREKNGHISEASNSALQIASGDYAGLLDHDDILWPNALFEVVNLLNQKKYDLIYSDEDKVSEDGLEHIEPFFKPNWNPDYLRSINYITHFTVIKKSLLDKLRWRSKYDGAQDWDLFLRCTNLTQNIGHIPKILYSWRISRLSAASAKSLRNVKKYVLDSQKKALEDDLVNRELKGSVEKTQYLGVWRVRYKINKPLVSIIIPTKDKLDYLVRCLNSIKKSSYKNIEIILIDTGSSEKTLSYYRKIRNKKIKTFHWRGQFNFSNVCNFGASKASGKHLIFLNNDTEILTKDWIENMLEHSQRPEIGAVGCKLVFPTGRIQHIGVILGISGGVSKTGIAGHPFKNFFNKKRNGGYSLIIDTIKNYSAVTAACMMVSKEKFNQVCGFDPSLRIAFNDVDFCLKLSKAGLFNLYTPYTVVRHWESVSVGVPGKKGRKLEDYYQEENLMIKRWGKLLKNDPFYNPNLTLKSEEYSLND